MIILILAAHSDDETIGLGGTIARHVRGTKYMQNILQMDWVLAIKRTGKLSLRERAAESAAKILGFEWLTIVITPTI